VRRRQAELTYAGAGWSLSHVGATADCLLTLFDEGVLTEPSRESRTKFIAYSDELLEAIETSLLRVSELPQTEESLAAHRALFVARGKVRGLLLLWRRAENGDEPERFDLVEPMVRTLSEVDGELLLISEFSTTLKARAAWEAARLVDESPVVAVPSPPRKDRTLLQGTHAICGALDLDVDNWKELKSLSERLKGPIVNDGSGSRPRVFKEDLIAWHDSLGVSYADRVNQSDGKKLAAESVHDYAANDEVAPEIAGSVKKRRKSRTQT